MTKGRVSRIIFFFGLMRRGSATSRDVKNIFLDTTHSAREALDHVRDRMLNKQQREAWRCRNGSKLISSARITGRADILALIVQQAPRDVKHEALLILAWESLARWATDRGALLSLHLEDPVDVQFAVFHAARTHKSLGIVLQCVTPAAALAPAVKTMVNDGFARARSRFTDRVPYPHTDDCLDMYELFCGRVNMVHNFGVEEAGVAFLRLIPLMGECVVEFVEMLHVMQKQDRRHIDERGLAKYLLRRLVPLAGLYREIRAVRAILAPGVLRSLVIMHLERMARYCCSTIEK